MKLPTNQQSIWSLLFDSFFIGGCVSFATGICGSLIVGLSFYLDFRHYLVAAIALLAGPITGGLWLVRHR